MQRAWRPFAAHMGKGGKRRLGPFKPPVTLDGFGEVSMTDHVRVSLDQGVLTLTLARPEKKNALTNAMYETVVREMNRAENDPDVRAIVLQADGDMFTAGND